MDFLFLYDIATYSNYWAEVDVSKFYLLYSYLNLVSRRHTVVWVCIRSMSFPPVSGECWSRVFTALWLCLLSTWAPTDLWRALLHQALNYFILCLFLIIEMCPLSFIIINLLSWFSSGNADRTCIWNNFIIYI